MRELTVRLKLTRHCLGNIPDKSRDGGRLIFPRTPEGRVTFSQSWHLRNMQFASQLLGRHQHDVRKIFWDAEVDGAFKPDRWFLRWYTGNNGRRRYAQHEAFFPGQVLGINCVVPTNVSDDDLLQLMNIAGRYKGLSPWSPGEYGQFQVESIVPRRPKPIVDPDEVVEHKKTG